MPRRIEYAIEHEQFIKDLVRSDESRGPFETKAKCLIFSATFGASFGPKQGRELLPEKGGRAEPIRYDVFHSAAFEELLGSLAVYANENIELLSNTEEAIDKQIAIFEEYAHCGLGKLKLKLSGERNLTDGIMLLLKESRPNQSTGADEIDWGKIASP